MALSVADNLRRCMERFGTNVAAPMRSRSMTRRVSPRYIPPLAQPKVETAPDAKDAEAPPPVD